MLFSVARVLSSFSPLSSSITRSDLNLALKFLLCLGIAMNPFFHIELSISDSLKTVLKSVLIYDTIIIWGVPVAGATLPVVAFFLLGVYGKVIWLLISVVILGIGHIGIHLQHRKKIKH